MDQNVQPPPASAIAGAFSVTVKVRQNLATQHLWAARRNAALCAKREAELVGQSMFDIEHRSQVITAVISAVGFLECLVNEVWQDAADSKPTEPLPRADGLPLTAFDTMGTLWRANRVENGLSVLDKYQVALTCAGKPPMDNSAEPFQSARRVIDLRNQLVHFKPEWQDTDVAHKLEKQLRREFPDNALLPNSSPWFPAVCLGAGCAQWACDRAEAFAAEWWKQIGLVNDYHADFDGWPDPTDVDAQP